MDTLSLGRHPGRAKGAAKPTLKGRQATPAAIAEIKFLLGDGPYPADETVEYLHAIQDAHGYISADHLAALADLMRLSLAELYEVASFYHAFDVVKEGDDVPPILTLRVCESLVCDMAGARDAAKMLAENFGDNVRVQSVACLGRCEQAPVCGVNNAYVKADEIGTVESLLTGDIAEEEPIYQSFNAYRSEGGYNLLESCLQGTMTPETAVGELTASGLRGLGGAGFPTGRKWQFVRAEAGPRFLVVNGDESEPGTFKDRCYLESDPHRFIEGMLIAAWAIDADRIYIYLRNEYPQLRALLECELRLTEQAGFLNRPVIFRRGAGAYICGEESAMLESLEGKRGLPRHKPPFPAQVGLFGKPTLINNIETLYWVPDAISAGAAWNETDGADGLRSYSVSGRIAEPGVKLAPAGITVRKLIEEYCGGMQQGHEFSAYLPGGASGGVFPASMDDIPLDFGAFEAHGGLIGSAAIIVLSQHDHIKDVTRNLLQFFAHESCGQCTPCRVGTGKAVKLMEEEKWDLPLLSDIADVMADGSICGLGQAAANPIKCALRYFPEKLS